MQNKMLKACMEFSNHITNTLPCREKTNRKSKTRNLSFQKSWQAWKTYIPDSPVVYLRITK